MWERACSRRHCVRQYLRRLTQRIREQARSHRYFAVLRSAQPTNHIRLRQSPCTRPCRPASGCCHCR
ncbi:hypothetical protein PspCFBP13508_18345 [Pseudomonas sp. CFBP13508]|nr:hypothetical protein PspCFBP13508_18345 [Pseudomonas sp. CFBP13508]